MIKNVLRKIEPVGPEWLAYISLAFMVVCLFVQPLPALLGWLIGTVFGVAFGVTFAFVIKWIESRQYGRRG